MKLELKHLAPYLPCGLEVELLRKEYNGIYIKYSINAHTDYPISFEVGGGVVYSAMLSEIKPILRPLSDLTKEIEVNGERFIPFDFFKEDEENEWFDGNVWVNYLFSNEKCDLDFIPYGMVQKLFEWQFDLFELIKYDLAIDINTLNK